MGTQPTHVNRRSALGILGATAAAAAWGTAGPAAAATSAHGAGSTGGTAVTLLIDGRPAQPGTYAFPDDVPSLVLDNGLIRYTFGRDDAAGGVVTGWPDVSITATSIVVDGTELAHNLNGVDPRDPDRHHSFYIDAGGGKTRLVCTRVTVLRVGPDLAEMAFIDDTGTPLQHEHHLIMRSGRRGLYGYDIMTAAVATSINEVRMNTRWDRAILDHCFNWERGKGRQPTYAYLATQQQVQDETWQVDGVNNPALPSPGSNSGNLPAGSVYTKYDWSLYHHENPMFGHYGNGFGAWCTPLGGVSDRTLAGFYGVGPQHQDLAIHQDALILNYFGANHYGLPAYSLQAGYRRLYGPWFNYVTTGDPADPDAMIADAARTALSEIAENRAGAAWVDDPLYPVPAQRCTVTGRLRIADGRSAANHWVLLSTQDAADVYSIHEPTYFVKTGADGSFTLPGIPQAWLPGTTTPGSYILYAFAADGSITDQYRRPGVQPRGAHLDLGDIAWSPTRRSTFLWQIGRADRTGGEYALATRSPALPSPRDYGKPARIPGDLTFTIGTDWEPRDWYYAQTNAGVWTVAFTVDRVLTGTAYLTVSSSMQQGSPPTVAVNGHTDGITGSLPADTDSTIARQTDRSGYPRLAVLTFPAAMLVAGPNTLTLTRGAGTAAGDGLGWDTIVLEVDEPQAPKAAKLTAQVTGPATADGAGDWQVRITNRGAGAAHDVRIDSVAHTGGGGPLNAARDRGRSAATVVGGPDPNAFPVPVTASLPPGGSVTTVVRIDESHVDTSATPRVEFGLTADGGRTRGTVTGTRRR